MTGKRLSEIRAAEKQSHEEIYSSTELFKEGSWLQKPVKTVLDIFPLLSDKETIKVLDLGCGIGRNCIPIAETFRNTCTIDCVDILDLAIEKLYQNAELHKVKNNINGIVSTIEDFDIKPCSYDLIIAVSALEHVCSESAFTAKLTEIKNGLKSDGIVCLIINSNVTETNKVDGELLQPQFEVNLTSDKLTNILNDIFNNFIKLKETKIKQQYDIPRTDKTVSLSTDVITLVVKK